MEKANPIEEARRYVANAEEIIKKASYDSELKIYTDSKYIKIAGDTLWKGCLIALDAVLDIRKGKGRPSIENTKKQPASATESCWLLLLPVMKQCTCIWAMTGQRTKMFATLVLRKPKPSSTVAPCCILVSCVHKQQSLREQKRNIILC